MALHLIEELGPLILDQVVVRVLRKGSLVDAMLDDLCRVLWWWRWTRR